MARPALTAVLLLMGATVWAAPEAAAVRFADLDWKVTDGVPLGDRTPGRVVSSAANVGLNDGALELRLTGTGAGALGAEAIAGTDYGFGTFTFDLEGPMAQADSSQAFTVGLQGPGAEGENAILVHFTHWSSEILSGDDARLTVFPSAGFQNPQAVPSWEASLDAAFQEGRMRVVLEWTPYKVSLKLLNTRGNVLDSTVFDSVETFQDLPQIPLSPVVRLWNFGRPSLRPLTVRVREFHYQPPKR